MSLAVFDLGKTNAKLFVFNEAGGIIHESRIQPKWRTVDDLTVLDEHAMFEWMEQALKDTTPVHNITGIMISGHGCTFALVDDTELTHPILDYEQEPPTEIAARIDDRIPGFPETFSPRLPLGFNYGRHMLWLAERSPGSFAKTKSILGYPQFWSWKFSGIPINEVSYLGCHSHLWAPLQKDFSSLVDAMGWKSKMPAFARAGALLGSYDLKLPDGSMRTLAVHNGVHDSNAALYFYRSLGLSDFTLVSTGTWVIIFNPNCPLGSLDAGKDMLANVSVDGEPVATIRFMGGREFDVISQGWVKSIEPHVIERVIERSIFALPSFAPGGPMPGQKGEVVGPKPTPEDRAAAAFLYVILMTDLSLDEIRSSSTVVVDGGLNRSGLFASLLAQLRPAQTIVQSSSIEGSATGAAALAFESKGLTPFGQPPIPVASVSITGLASYRDSWRQQAVERRSVALASALLESTP